MPLFAKLNTTQKAFINCPMQYNHYAQKSLNAQYGGNWVVVDDVLFHKQEILMFDDGMEYKGMEAGKDRYSNAIVKLR